VISINNLIKKAQTGNDKAFLKIFQRFEKDVYRMAFVYVKNSEDALDVVQEVAYQSFKKISTLRQPEKFKSWIFSITIHCAIDLIRKRKNVVNLNTNYEDYMEQGNNDHFADHIPLSITLQDLINNLKEVEKSVVMLKFYHDYTLKDIAELLDIPIGTVKSVLYRSLEKLRGEYLKGDGMNE
jgi:RNA polymerase sigma-70 factor (ECF subfamily)